MRRIAEMSYEELIEERKNLEKFIEEKIKEC